MISGNRRVGLLEVGYGGPVKNKAISCSIILYVKKIFIILLTLTVYTILHVKFKINPAVQITVYVKSLWKSSLKLQK